jgi:toxin ParE1/3/4
LEKYPARGRYPKELERLGVLLYREVYFKTYRIIYQIQGREVIIHAVVDGRRELREFLERRLIRP